MKAARRHSWSARLKTVRVGAYSAPDVGDDDRGERYGGRFGDAPTEAPRTEARGGVCGSSRDRTVRLCVDRLRAPGPKLSTPEAVCRFLRDMGMAARDRESFYAISLDVRHRVLAVEEVARGHLTGVEVHPREVFKTPMLVNAARLIVAHNHPSGETEPSPQDVTLTHRLSEAGRLIGIPLLDHVVVAGEGCGSLQERGMLGGARLSGARRRPARRR